MFKYSKSRLVNQWGGFFSKNTEGYYSPQNIKIVTTFGRLKIDLIVT